MYRGPVLAPGRYASSIPTYQKRKMRLKEMKVLGPHRVNDGTGPPKPRHPCIQNQCVQMHSCTLACTHTHILPTSDTRFMWIHSLSLLGHCM